jgi:hypothetical protein
VNSINKLPAASNGGKLTIQMPSDVKLLSDICQAQTSTLTLTCVAKSDASQLITVTSLQELPKGTTITVTLPGNVRNPQTGAQSQPFIINTYFMDIFQVDTSSALRVRADTFNDILNANSNRDE